MNKNNREELVKLADRLAALPTFKMATVVTVPGVALNAAERDLIVTALRHLASSDSDVTVEELALDLQDVVVKIRAQNWKFGGTHVYDSDEAARILACALFDQFEIRRK